MYYKSFPQAPVALVSGVSALSGIGTITDARVCRDNSVILEVFVGAGAEITIDKMAVLIDYFGIEPDDLRLMPGPDAQKVSIEAWSTCFDFSSLFEEAEYGTVVDAEVVEQPNFDEIDLGPPSFTNLDDVLVGSRLIFVDNDLFEVLVYQNQVSGFNGTVLGLPLEHHLWGETEADLLAQAVEVVEQSLDDEQEGCAPNGTCSCSDSDDFLFDDEDEDLDGEEEIDQAVALADARRSR